MLRKDFIVTFLLLFAAALLLANMPFPYKIIDNGQDYTGKIIEIRGFSQYPETDFYLLDATDGLIIIRKISHDVLRIKFTGKKKCCISWHPLLAELQENTKYSPDSDAYKSVMEKTDIKYGMPPWIYYKRSYQIWFQSWQGYKTKGTKLKTISYMLIKSQLPLPFEFKYGLVPDKMNIPRSKYYDENGKLTLWGILRQTFDLRYYKRNAEVFIGRWERKIVGPGYYKYHPPADPNWKLKRFYRKTIGAYPHFGLLSRSYEHIEQVMQENRNYYSVFFLFAAIVTIITELLVLLLLFNPVCGIPLRDKILKLIPACVLGTGFTIFMLWWVFPGLLHTYAKVTMGGEIFALIIEAIIYWVVLRIKFKFAFILSFAANLSSYLLGVWLFHIVFLFI